MIRDTRSKPHRITTASRRRGGVYLAVLGASMVITILGVAGIFAVRIQSKVAAAANDTVRASSNASAAIELARHRIANDAGWRPKYSNDSWVTEVAFDGGRITFKLVDEADANLSNDATQNVRLHGRATVGKAVRIHSVELAPDASKMVPVEGSWRQEILP